MPTFAASTKATNQSKTVAPGFGEFAWGVDATASTTVTITVPSMAIVLGVVAGGNTSTTVVFTDQPASNLPNQFRITKADSDVVSWIAIGRPRL